MVQRQAQAPVHPPLSIHSRCRRRHHRHLGRKAQQEPQEVFDRRSASQTQQGRPAHCGRNQTGYASLLGSFKRSQCGSEGGAIAKKLGISVISDSTTQDLFRGIRTQIASLLGDINVDERDLTTMSLGLSHSLSRCAPRHLLSCCQTRSAQIQAQIFAGQGRHDDCASYCAAGRPRQGGQYLCHACQGELATRTHSLS
jgi:hypothetical protein